MRSPVSHPSAQTVEDFYHLEVSLSEQEFYLSIYFVSKIKINETNGWHTVSLPMQTAAFLRHIHVYHCQVNFQEQNLVISTAVHLICKLL